MERNSRIFVAGHRGLAGSAIVRALRAAGYDNLLLSGRDALDLRVRSDLDRFFAGNRPEYVFMAAAKWAGFWRTVPIRRISLYDNLAIELNIIDSAWRHGTAKLLFLGSSCIYPRLAPQPIREEHLLTGELEPTNEWYAIAKIAGVQAVPAYRKQHGFNAICLMPTNLYGPGDNFDPDTSHVLPALCGNLQMPSETDAPEVVMWGTGAPRREFLARGRSGGRRAFPVATLHSPEPVNIGTGEDLPFGNWLR